VYAAALVLAVMQSAVENLLTEAIMKQINIIKYFLTLLKRHFT